MANELGIMRGLDLVCRGAVRKLTQRVVTIEKKLQIMIRFVLRRSKEVNGRLDDLEEIAGKHSRCVSSIGRSMQYCSKLFAVMGGRIDKLVEVLKAHEGDMDDNSEDCADMWNHIRNIEADARHSLVVRNRLFDKVKSLENKVDALEKIHTTKIAAFIYGAYGVKLQRRVDALEALHTTKIDGAAINQSPPDSTLGSTCFKGTHEEGN